MQRGWVISRVAGAFLVTALVFVGAGAAAQEEATDAPDDGQEEAAPAGTGEQQAAMPAGVDGQITLQNVGADEWRVADIQGEGIYTGVGGATVHLEVGGRYRFDLSGVNSEQLPVDIRGLQGDVLISQRDDAAAATPNGTNPDVSAEGISFTLSETLAERITYFRAATYPSMVGFIVPLTEEDLQGAQTGQQDETATE